MFKVGIRLVRSNRSNPALKQGLAKARFLQKEYDPTNIFSAAAEAKPGWRLFLQNPWPVLPCILAGRRPCFCQSLSRNLRQIRMN